VVEEKAASDYVRRYSTGKFADPMALVARSWERSLSPPASPAEFNPPSTYSFNGVAAKTAFSPAWHWDNFFLDVAPFQYFGEKCTPTSVLDIGCGIGTYLHLFKQLGTKLVFGVDGVRKDPTV
jgi:SAM-dependent methyltransferase